MDEKEVRKKVGKHWKEFNKFMYGQTVGINKNGTMNYYDYDVHRFLAQFNKKLDKEKK